MKSLTEEGSAGISSASIVHDDAKLKERVEFIHRTTNSTALAEQFIEGREIYVGVMGKSIIFNLHIPKLSFCFAVNFINLAAKPTNKINYMHTLIKQLAAAAHVFGCSPLFPCQACRRAHIGPEY